MIKFLTLRLINYIILVFIATSLAYFLASLTLHPEAIYDGRNPPIPKHTVANILNAVNSNPHVSIWLRYGRWLRGVSHGNFGHELNNPSQSITSDMGRRIGVSLRLQIIGAVVGTVAGVVIGVYGAVRQRKVVDSVSTFGSYVILATPAVVLILLLQAGAVWLNNKSGSVILPTALEYNSTLHGWHFWIDRGQRLILPTIVLASGNAAFFSRYQRSAMLDVLGSDFLRTARAKGLTRRQALTRHGVRTAMIPMVTFFAYGFGLLVVSSFFVEVLFGWHGMGEFFISSLQAHDVNEVAAVTAFVAVLILISGMASDILYVALDPRVRSR